MGSVAASRVLLLEGTACWLCVGRLQGYDEDTECPSCLASCLRPDRLLYQSVSGPSAPLHGTVVFSHGSASMALTTN